MKGNQKDSNNIHSISAIVPYVASIRNKAKLFTYGALF